MRSRILPKSIRMNLNERESVLGFRSGAKIDAGADAGAQFEVPSQEVGMEVG